jgi:hypothetical protein
MPCATPRKLMYWLHCSVFVVSDVQHESERGKHCSPNLGKRGSKGIPCFRIVRIDVTLSALVALAYMGQTSL